MKNLPFLTIISSVILMTIFSSNTFFPHHLSMNQSLTDTTDNYLPYYEKIKEALIYYKDDKDYPKTIETFKEAFDMVSTPMAMDVLDALYVSIELESEENMFYFARILVEKGCEVPFFDREDLKKLKDYPKEFEALMNHIDYVQANAEKYWNVELREKMHALFRKDQDIAYKYKGKNEYGNNWLLVTEYQEDVKLPFLELIKEHGMVGEKELGIFFRDPQDSTDYGLIQTFPGIIILHIIQSGEHSRFTEEEINLYTQEGYMPWFTAKYINGNKKGYRFGRDFYKKTNEMIQRNAPEDSIMMQVRLDWKMEESVRTNRP
ncbi:MAG: hypothetical protein AB8G11_03485 [Saprospiraceae bacterium]